MKNAHLVLPQEEDTTTEYLPPKYCMALIVIVTALCFALCFLIVNHYAGFADDLRGQLYSSQKSVETLEREKRTLERELEEAEDELTQLRFEAGFGE